jgi:HSP20 family molecular chaperone IbpA
VSERAYRLYESSGWEHGNHHAHWLQAQNEVLQRGLEIRESGSWLSINAALPGVEADHVEVYLEPTRVIVRAEKSESNQDSDTREISQQEVFLLQDLDTEVDPATASAAFKDQKLTLMVKKRYPMASGTPIESTTRS